MRRYWILTRSILVMNLRNKSALVGNLIFPIGLLLLFGALYRDRDAGATTVAAWFMAGVMVQTIMTSGFAGDAAWLTTARDRGILQRIRATPLPPAVLVGAYVMVRLLLVVAQCTLIAVVAMMVFGVRIEWRELAQAFAVVLLGGSVFLVMGQAIAAVAPNANASGVIANLLFFPLLFLSDLVVTATSLPTRLADITRWNPAYMLVDLLRPALLPVTARQAAGINVVGLLCYGLLCMLIVARFFR